MTPLSSTPLSSQGPTQWAPSRLETEPLTSLLFQSEEPSSLITRTTRLQPNQRNILPLTRREEIMLQHPSPSPRFPHIPRRARHPHPSRFPRDLRIPVTLGLIAIMIVHSLAMIQIGIAIAPKHSSGSGGGSKLSSNTIQNIIDTTRAGSVSQACQKLQ